jgi:hypothetical protein
MLPKELPQELELAPAAPDSTEFTYFKHAEMSFTERSNFNMANTKIEIENGDDGEYEYSQHFGSKERRNSKE